MKKLLIACLAIVFLTACGPKVKVEFEPPASGPDPDRFQPSYGPNDPVPVAQPTS
ncbi:hypothetical protein KKA33_04080 [Patescibacteria group bacterium]|nr:hypothetical protein [Patescibacteria group bacterium]